MIKQSLRVLPVFLALTFGPWAATPLLAAPANHWHTDQCRDDFPEYSASLQTSAHQVSAQPTSVKQGSNRAPQAIDILSYEWRPAVMPFDRPLALPMVLSVNITGGANTARLTLTNAGGTVSLRDDGVAPDLIAGDLHFSGNVSVQSVLDRNPADRVHKAFLGQAQGLDAGNNPTGPLINVILPVMPAEARSISVSTVSANIRTTPWLINVRDDLFANDFNLQRVTQTALAQLGDRYQFAHIVFAPKNFVQNRSHGRVRNNIQGIGSTIFDTGASWGSAANLIGFTQFPNLSFYDMQGPGVLHETGHQWINALNGIFADPRSGAHWPVSSFANNIMGISLVGGAGGNLSCALTSNGSSISTQAQLSSNFFNDWELYLMGMSPSVTPGFVVTDQTAAGNLINTSNWCNGSTYNLATTAVNLTTLVNNFGSRVPAFASAPKYFRVLTIVASSGRTMGDDELAYISFMTARAQLPGFRPWSEGLATSASGPTFYDATNGVGKLDFRLDGQFQHGFE